MSGIYNQQVCGLGATLINVGTGNTATAVTPPAHCMGYYLKYASGGSLSIVNQQAQAGSLGYVLGTEVLSIDGPAQFFLNATGATSVAAVVFKLSAAYSLLP